MGRYVNVTATVDVDVDMEDIDTDDLIAELESRGQYVDGMEPADVKGMVQTIWEKRRNGHTYERELDNLIYSVLGRIV